MKFLLSVLLVVFMINGCGDSKKDTADILLDNVVSQKAVKVELPDSRVSVYPLGEPGLNNYFANLDRDNEGIILLNAHGNIATYEPGMIAKYAMATYRSYLKSGNESILNDGISHADWLVDNIHCDDKFGYWLLDAPLDNLVVWESPFKSAMTNGLAIYALTQMLEFTSNKKGYLDTIECALKAFNYDISDGGVTSITDDYIWFEEYALESRSKVLNGGIFALTGIWAAKEYLKSAYAADLFDKMVAAIVLRINEYDYGHTTLYHTNMISGTYSDFGRPVHGQYNEIHALQLQWLYSLTGNASLLEKAKHFYGYESFEIEKVTKNENSVAKMIDPYKYHSYEVFTANDNIIIELIAGHKLKELHLFFYGNHNVLPEISLLTEENEIVTLSGSSIKYFQDEKHHTSIGIYVIESDVEIKNNVQLTFNGYTYTDNYKRNLLRQIEVLTDDDEVFFWQKYHKWANQGDWKTIYPTN